MRRRLLPMRTQRLLLRPLRQDDLPAVVDIQAAEETHPYERAPATPAQARERFAIWRQHWAAYGFGYVAVVEVDSATVVGIGGVQVRDLDGERVLNLYYRFLPAAWGKGYATEMARAVLEWTRRELPERAVVVITAVDNAPARRVADKLGLRQYHQDYYEGMPAVFYRLDGQPAAGDSRS
nr:GNAT family N-acetyltransferase [Saccharomonospora marina]